jgi:GT2 family glycosyltransferase
MTLNLYRKVGPLDESLIYCYDTDYCWKAQIMGFHLQYVPEAMLHYRLRHTFKAMYRQAKNWGSENHLLTYRYTQQLPRKHLLFGLTRDLIPHLYKGSQLLWQHLRQAPGSKGTLALWVWSLGFRVGQIQGIAKHFPRQGLIRDLPQFSLRKRIAGRL